MKQIRNTVCSVLTALAVIFSVTAATLKGASLQDILLVLLAVSACNLTVFRRRRETNEF